MNAKGMRRVPLAEGKVHVFSDARRIILQVRANGPDDNPLITWAKAAAALSPADAVQLAGELFHAAMHHERTAETTAKPPPPSPNNPQPKPKAKAAAQPAANSAPKPKPKPNPSMASSGPSKPTTPP